jgi:hypothetical protein
VAQLGARLDGIEEVVGSNPIGSTKFARASIGFFLPAAELALLPSFHPKLFPRLWLDPRLFILFTYLLACDRVPNSRQTDPLNAI